MVTSTLNIQANRNDLLRLVCNFFATVKVK